MMLEYDLLGLTNFDGGDGLGDLWWFYGDRSSEVDIDVALDGVMTKPYAATTHGGSTCAVPPDASMSSARTAPTPSDVRSRHDQHAGGDDHCEDGPTRSIAGTDTTSALQRRRVFTSCETHPDIPPMTG